MTSLSKIALSSIAICGLAACTAPAEQMHSESEFPAHGHVVATGDKNAPFMTVKAGANVTLESTLPKDMTSGQYQTVRLDLRDGYSDGALSLSVEPSEGLSLFGGQSTKTFDMTGSGPHSWDVDVKAEADGVYFLNVFAEAKGFPRSFSVRLDIGQISQKMISDAMPENGSLTDGGKIRALEADETIK